MNCEVCKVNVEEDELRKCPICHKMFCQDCAIAKGGLQFCSRRCLEFFFYGEPEEEE